MNEDKTYNPPRSIEIKGIPAVNSWVYPDFFGRILVAIFLSYSLSFVAIFFPMGGLSGRSTSFFAAGCCER